jgi:Integrase core domain/HTH-like domain
VLDVARFNPTDGTRMVAALAARQARGPVNRKRVQRLMREHALLQPKRSDGRRRRPGYFQVTRPDELWHLDMTSVWVAEHGWCYLNAAIDCCTREIVGWALDVRCRAAEATAVLDVAVADRRIGAGELTLGTDNATAFTSRAFRARLAEHQVEHRRGGSRDPRAERSSSPGSPSSSSAASGARSSRPSTRPAPSSAPTSTATTTAPTKAAPTAPRAKSQPPARSPKSINPSGLTVNTDGVHARAVTGSRLERGRPGHARPDASRRAWGADRADWLNRDARLVVCLRGRPACGSIVVVRGCFQRREGAAKGASERCPPTYRWSAGPSKGFEI